MEVEIVDFLENINWVIRNAEEPRNNRSSGYFTESNTKYVINEGELFRSAQFEVRFIIFSSNSDCKYFDGCTKDTCSEETKLCNNTYIENEQSCTSCNWLYLNITTDNYPDETKWSLEEQGTHSLVILGEYYVFETRDFGRKRNKSNGRKIKKSNGRKRKNI